MFTSIEHVSKTMGIKFGEVHIAHKSKGAFRSWEVPLRCKHESANTHYAYSIVFDKDMFKYYENKKVQTQKGSFPIFDAKVYVFRRVQDSTDDEQADEELEPRTVNGNAELKNFAKDII